MPKREPPSEDAFDKLLFWLNPDRNKAAEKYEIIRIRLIGVFSSRGHVNAEDLTDDTVNVVAGRIDWLLENFQGEPALFFYGVARKIHLEELRKRPPPAIPPPDPPDPEKEELSNYLERCLDELPQKERELIVRYHEGEKQVKIQNRKRLAREWEITPNALRIKVYHLHLRLKPCIEAYMRGTA